MQFVLFVFYVGRGMGKKRRWMALGRQKYNPRHSVNCANIIDIYRYIYTHFIEMMLAVPDDS